MPDTDGQNIFYAYIMEYHYRVSVTSRDSAVTVSKNILNAFSDDLASYAMAYEVKTEEGKDNHHIHCFLEYSKFNEETFQKRRQRLVKTWKSLNLVPNLTGAQYHEKQNKSRAQNLRYCLKDKDILANNLTDDELEEITKDNERIENEKQVPMKEQLYNEWVKQNTQTTRTGGQYVSLPQTKYEIFIFIDAYHVEREYLPPTLTLKTQYALFILIRLNNAKKATKYYNDVDASNFFSIYCALSNIRMDDMPVNEIPKKITYDLKPLKPKRHVSVSDTEEDLIDYNCEFIN